MMPKNRLHLPVKGLIKDVDLVIPEIDYLEMNGYESSLQAKNNNDAILSLSSVYFLAQLMRGEPTEKQVEYFTAKMGMQPDYFRLVHRALHDWIWKNNLWIRVKELLMWKDGKESYLMKDYEVTKVNGQPPSVQYDKASLVPVKWPMEYERLTRKRASELLNIPESFAREIDLFADSYHHSGDDIRTLYMIFNPNSTDALYSDRPLTYSHPSLGCLTGKVEKQT
ncbi:MAG: hypothetical protein HYW24_03630 [Candidatus Aenigmarchaeota archaeon]|nr:hypothetical protein [Candidatus Aenigmarchaeota archaeon]